VGKARSSGGVESLFRLRKCPTVSKAQPSSTVFLADCLFAGPGDVVVAKQLALGVLFFSKIEIKK
jgi:hypothetical protein